MWKPMANTVPGMSRGSQEPSRISSLPRKRYSASALAVRTAMAVPSTATTAARTILLPSRRDSLAEPNSSSETVRGVYRSGRRLGQGHRAVKLHTASRAAGMTMQAAVRARISRGTMDLLIRSLPAFSSAAG